ncbi:MAG: DUF1015 domain-containing protein [bacterium]
MAGVFPFKGEVYNKEKVDIAFCVTPPYDVISEKEQIEYYKKSPYNIIRLILSKEENRYEKAKEVLALWRRDNIFIEEEKEHFYLYEQEWEIFGERGKFQGIIASIELEDYSSGIILPHERILKKPKVDRLKLLQACNTNFSPIFLIFSDNGRVKSLIKPSNPPFIEFEYKNGLFCRLFRTKNEKSIQEEFQGKKLFIADGHHRYDTALTYFKETDDEKKKRAMALISSIEYGGFKILPAHRIIKRMPDMEKIRHYFNVEEVSKEGILPCLSERKEIGVFGVCGRDTSFIITLKDKGLLSKIKEELRMLDVSILHILLFDGKINESEIEYTIDRDLVFNRAMNGDYGFFLRPTDISDVLKIASSRNRMPGKATYFYPKPFCGLVIHPLK